MKNFKRVTINEITAPNDHGFYQMLPNFYWITNGTEVLLYRGKAPQCNANANIALNVGKSLKVPGFDKIVFLDRAYVPIDFRDWTG